MVCVSSGGVWLLLLGAGRGVGNFSVGSDTFRHSGPVSRLPKMPLPASGRLSPARRATTIRSVRLVPNDAINFHLLSTVDTTRLVSLCGASSQTPDGTGGAPCIDRRWQPVGRLFFTINDPVISYHQRQRRINKSRRPSAPPKYKAQVGQMKAPFVDKSAGKLNSNQTTGNTTRWPFTPRLDRCDVPVESARGTAASRTKCVTVFSIQRAGGRCDCY